MVTVKPHSLRQKTKPELEKQLDELKTELAQLRVAQKVQGRGAKLGRIKIVRKSIARVLTVYNQQRKSSIRQEYEGKKYLPTDIRPRKTRAIRRALIPEQAEKKTLKAAKQAANFPPRRYWLRA